MMKKETPLIWTLIILTIIFAAVGFYLGWLDNGPRPLF